jgi:oxepin-CoA hydrolase / 3-oxo-5,6-dehydrosuberyl-CoA semialdehyde dehydrogenase
MKTPFDVNDAEVRDRFLRDGFRDALRGLPPDRAPRWGRMTPQQMVEHLAWTFQISTGQIEVECLIPEPRRERMKPFLHDDRPSPRDFRNPLLEQGLPPLRHPGLGEAVAALQREMERFLAYAKASPGGIHTHPVFGPIGLEEWSRAHFKHCYHHLRQFGLVEEGSEAA